MTPHTCLRVSKRSGDELQPTMQRANFLFVIGTYTDLMLITPAVLEAN
jgi:hypothetical protein